MLAALAGCGGGSLDASTAPLSDGDQVSPQRYLADTSAAAAAINDFSSILGDVAPVARRAALVAVAPRLDAARDRAAAIADRIDAQRLEDRRLEDQRSRAAVALSEVVVGMTLVSDAAAAGEPATMEAVSGRYAASVDDLRALTAEP